MVALWLLGLSGGVHGQPPQKSSSFFFVNQPMAWGAAEAFCNSKAAQLAEIRTSAENEQVLAIAQRNEVASLGNWFGCNANTSTGIFVYGNSSNGKNMTYTNWGQGQPSQQPDYQCCRMWTNKRGSWDRHRGGSLANPGDWGSGQCSVRLPFFCQATRPTVAPTPAPPTPKPTPSPTAPFFYVRKPKQWADAKAYCEARSAELALIRSPADNLAVQSLAMMHNAANTHNRVWIGLSDRAKESHFEWVDGSKLEWSNWNALEPNSAGNEDCVDMYADGGKWNDDPCSRKNPFVCLQIKPTAAPTPYPTPPPTPPTVAPTPPPTSLYFFVSQPMTWAESQSYCSQHAGQLTTIVDGDENSAVMDVVKTANGPSYGTKGHQTGTWIGCSDRSKEGKWRWTDGSPLTNYSAWAPHEPNQKGGEEDCCEMSFHGTWNDVTCASNLPFVCMQLRPTPPPTPAPTPPPTVPPILPDYFFVNELLAWKDANARCSQLHPNSFLAAVHNVEANKAVQGLGLVHSSDIWVGGNDLGGEGNWVWADASKWGFDHWATGEPNGKQGENCVEVNYNDGSWNDASCSIRHRFVCQQGPSPTAPPTLPPTPAPTTAAPTAAPTRIAGHHFDDDVFDDDANDDDAADFPFHNQPTPISVAVQLWGFVYEIAAADYTGSAAAEVAQVAPGTYQNFSVPIQDSLRAALSEFLHFDEITVDNITITSITAHMHGEGGGAGGGDSGDSGYSIPDVSVELRIISPDSEITTSLLFELLQLQLPPVSSSALQNEGCQDLANLLLQEIRTRLCDTCAPSELRLGVSNVYAGEAPTPAPPVNPSNNRPGHFPDGRHHGGRSGATALDAGLIVVSLLLVFALGLAWVLYRRKRLVEKTLTAEVQMTGYAGSDSVESSSATATASANASASAPKRPLQISAFMENSVAPTASADNDGYGTPPEEDDDRPMTVANPVVKAQQNANPRQQNSALAVSMINASEL